MNREEKFMAVALKEAKKAYDNNEVPIGAVIVKDNVIISKSFNKREKTNNPLAHAEILAIQKAAKKLNSWKLHECEMYVSLEPCYFCSALIIESQIKKVYVGTLDNYNTGFRWLCNSIPFKNNSKIPLFKSGILEAQCQNIIEDFFVAIRNK